ncbi:hypothetical protein PARPLA_00231 [Rhodobacteraceae bacterium THAF1]|uniref:hypothetical protein n=1 Tax=Palleronia sp. THAF1 TaxID=2587842 RepID=UPI000F40DB9B|nr:hypothetical protein [Palleronia sp. THAF1]QFU10204.1 hypothetical protein FIU81_16105 [Palleronia sp. THAF1]VDC16891.1 hypothetical protein PARPLA_00231 [Rhodobacteraceae bacterium THAF1]
MTRRLSDLLNLTATTGDSKLPVRAVFHDRQTLELRQVAVDAGSWLSRHEVLVAIDRFDAPGDETWPLRISEDDLKNAPEWEHTDSAIGLPPLVTGPFGYTFSPMMMAAGMATSTERAMPGVPENQQDIVGQDEHGRLAGLERSSDLVGPDAFGPNGRIGEVTDLLLSDDLQIVALIVGKDDPVEMRIDRARHRADQGYFVFD